jgi:hypothetical protein
MNPSSNIIGYRRNGCPIRLIRGASPEGDAKSGEAGKEQGDNQAGADGAKQDAGTGEKDTPLGEGGLKALQAERDARQALETELRQFKTGLAEVLGIDSKDAKSDDLVPTLQREVQEMRREVLVDRIAREAKISDDDDLELLKTASDEATMRKLAARLAKKADDDDTGKNEATNGRRQLKPDPSQARGGKGESKPSSIAAVMEERRAAREARSQKQ